MKDSTLLQTALMPNAAATVNTNTIEMAQRVVRPHNTDFRVRLYNGQATGANSKNITYSIQATNEANGANAVTVQSFVVAGNAANHPASSREIVLPPDLNRRFIRASATGELNGGNAADGTFGIEIII